MKYKKPFVKKFTKLRYTKSKKSLNMKLAKYNPSKTDSEIKPKFPTVCNKNVGYKLSCSQYKSIYKSQTTQWLKQSTTQHKSDYKLRKTHMWRCWASSTTWTWFWLDQVKIRAKETEKNTCGIVKNHQNPGHDFD